MPTKHTVSTIYCNVLACEIGSMLDQGDKDILIADEFYTRRHQRLHTSEASSGNRV